MLAEVVLRRGAAPTDVRVTRDGTDVTHRFHLTREGRLVGVARGLDVGRNVLAAELGDQVARTRVTNHPRGGPVLSGPQTDHYRCQETAVDAQCNEPAS